MLSIILPNYNEPKIESLEKELALMFPEAEIITITDRYGMGKGLALRKGLGYARGDIICFLDADRDIPPHEILSLLPYLKDYDIVIANKSISCLPFRRKILTWASRKFIKLLFRLPLNDTQTGLKIFKRRVLPEWKTNGFAVDIEILSKCRNYKIKEVPVVCDVSGTKSLKDILTTFVDTIKIWCQ